MFSGMMRPLGLPMFSVPMMTIFLSIAVSIETRIWERVPRLLVPMPVGAVSVIGTVIAV